ncbi:MAG TPA: Alw26I/Eco31I/Esp3I family type II restriction adenine-specific DNA-methyltransferase [Gemmatimonadaceae bacterium]|nr:Alw26I/Eco31I/Esp3I family type II restriction adenine-specific DNA-methyltransferase [Gemmatimonadaceae bacterium]
MRHLSFLADSTSGQDGRETIRATGRFYTSRQIGDHLVVTVWDALSPSIAANACVRICDPFGGDGRLVVWLIEEALANGRTDIEWDVTIWDLHEPGLLSAGEKLRAISEEHGIHISVRTEICDAIMKALVHEATFDVVVTNPPWENLKPDRREFEGLTVADRDRYVAAIREYDVLLGLSYPLSQPERKFAGWGTNLARVGVETALRLVVPNGVAGIVSPASLLADDSSVGLRKWMVTCNTMLDAAYVPAEARQFSGADVSTAIVVLQKRASNKVAPNVTIFDAAMRPDKKGEVFHSVEFLRRTGYVIPISFGLGRMDVLQRLSCLPTWADLEIGDLWAGRELDETGVNRWLSDVGAGRFVKGRMIDRLSIVAEPTQFVNKPGWRIPRSVSFERIAWRDVSRPSQKRRIIATLIPPGWITGNSLGVAHFRIDDGKRVRALLAIMSSLVFEFQLRCFLATGHVSLHALRKVHIPDLSTQNNTTMLAAVADDMLLGLSRSGAHLEATAAHAYGITASEFAQVISAFPKVASAEAEDMLVAYEALASTELVVD